MLVGIVVSDWLCALADIHVLERVFEGVAGWMLSSTWQRNQAAKHITNCNGHCVDNLLRVYGKPMSQLEVFALECLDASTQGHCDTENTKSWYAQQTHRADCASAAVYATCCYAVHGVQHLLENGATS